MADNKSKMAGQDENRASVHARRLIAYIVLILVSFLCLFWFYALFINATRSNGELASGFSLLPGTALVKNWNSMLGCAASTALHASAIDSRKSGVGALDQLVRFAPAEWMSSLPSREAIPIEMFLSAPPKPAI